MYSPIVFLYRGRAHFVYYLLLVLIVIIIRTFDGPIIQVPSLCSHVIFGSDSYYCTWYISRRARTTLYVPYRYYCTDE